MIRGVSSAVLSGFGFPSDNDLTKFHAQDDESVGLGDEGEAQSGTGTARNATNSRKDGATGPSHKTYKDPPARERPTDDVWPERDALSFTRSLVFYGTGAITNEHVTASKFIMEARALRKKYRGGRGTRVENEFDLAESTSEFGFRMTNGIAQLLNQDGKSLVDVPDIDEFIKDYKRIETICGHGAMRSFCFQRLQMLDSAFKMHVTGTCRSYCIYRSFSQTYLTNYLP
jgi:hypothetical protein